MNKPEEELKRLLLAPELDLLRRVDERCSSLEDRFRDDPATRESVRRVIVGALRDAGLQDHEGLASVLAPVVLASIRSEIRNSRDMMVDALYPITGRLVAAAVRNAFRELIETINDRLDRSLSVERWKVWLQSRVTGRSEAEILLQRSPPFFLDDLLLIHRPTGLLIAHVHQRDQEAHLDSDLVGGMLSAIMSFARDAMGSPDESEISTISFDDSELLLKTSPAVILAAKVRGNAPLAFIQDLDRTFIELIESWGGLLRNFDGNDGTDVEDLRKALQADFDRLRRPDRKKEKKAPYKGYAVVGVLALLLIGWVGYVTYEERRAAGYEAEARAAIASIPGLEGYPLEVTFDADSDRLLIQGLLPDPSARDAMETELTRALPEVPRDYRVSALPEQLTPGMTVAERSVLADVKVAQSALLANTLALAEELRTVEAALQDAARSFDNRWAETDEASRSFAEARFASVAESLTALELDLVAAREEIDRVAAEAQPRAGADTLALRSLERWAQLNTIVFSEDSNFRDPVRTWAKLKRLVQLVVDAGPGVRLRVVGYADLTGTEGKNRRVSTARAEVVANALRDLGLPPERLVAVGRGSEKLVSTAEGVGSENRRVEIEVETAGLSGSRQ